MNIKKILSYFIPINIHQKTSEINNKLEITWNNGQLVLDSKNTNFSYGSLQRVLRFGLLQIGFNKINHYENILILGVAGGSVIKTLVDEIKFEGKITGVEIDEVVIELGNQYFGLNSIKNLEIIITDAQFFVDNNSQKYDLIIIDIFQDHIMPEFLFDEKYVDTIVNILNPNGTVLFNTINSTNNDQIRNEKYNKLVHTKFKTIQRHSHVEGNNELFILS